MTHPIVGIWAVDIDLGGQHTFVTHAFHADGIMHIKAGYGESDILWRATGERTFRLHGQIPIEPEAFQFVGWQYLDGDGEVSEVGDTYTARGDIDQPRPDGSRVTSHSTLIGTRVVFGSE
jgi:hypothetical protein